MSIKIIVADDDNLFREGVCLLIDCEEDLEVIARTGESHGLSSMIQWMDPDVLVLAVDMERGAGFQAGQMVMSAAPDLPILALVSSPTPTDWLNLSEAGYAGCLGKICTSEELKIAIRRLSQGERFLSGDDLPGDGLPKA